MLDDRFDYQQRLRALGAFLDDHNACMVNVMEMPDGFSVRSYHDPADLEGVSLVFGNKELDCFELDLEWRRARRLHDDSRMDSYQDFFRVLGSELERERARYVVLDEVDDSFVLTYLYVDPDRGFMWRKRHVTLGLRERQAAVRAAHRRRRHEEHGLLERLILISPTVARHDQAPLEALSEPGEHELYRTELPNAWTRPGRQHGTTDLLVTNRRIVLHCRQGGTDRTLLDVVTGVSTQTVGSGILKLHAVDVHRDGMPHLSLECRSATHMAEIAQRIEEALSLVQV